jgi:hypothetical protein
MVIISVSKTLVASSNLAGPATWFVRISEIMLDCQSSERGSTPLRTATYFLE